MEKEMGALYFESVEEFEEWAGGLEALNTVCDALRGTTAGQFYSIISTAIIEWRRDNPQDEKKMTSALIEEVLRIHNR